MLVRLARVSRRALMLPMFRGRMLHMVTRGSMPAMRIGSHYRLPVLLQSAEKV
jgi:hypothetical protein